MNDHAHATPEQLQTIRSIMKDVRVCMLTTVTPSGELHSHPMTTQQAEFDGDCWFITPEDSSAASHVAASPRVNIAYAGSSSWLSLAGTATVVRDAAKKKQLWNTFDESWFPDGENDPSVVLLHVDVASAQFWDSPGRLAAMVSMLKAKVSGDQAQAGESESVDL